MLYAFGRNSESVEYTGRHSLDIGERLLTLQYNGVFITTHPKYVIWGYGRGQA